MSVAAVAQSIRILFPPTGSTNDTLSQQRKRLASADLSPEEREAILTLYHRLQADPGWKPSARPARLDIMAQDGWM